MSFNQNSTFGFGNSGSGGGGGGLTAANNGLSVTGGNTVVLGNDVGDLTHPAILTSTREIVTTANYAIRLKDVAGAGATNETFINSGTIGAISYGGFAGIQVYNDSDLSSVLLTPGVVWIEDRTTNLPYVRFSGLSQPNDMYIQNDAGILEVTNTDQTLQYLSLDITGVFQIGDVTTSDALLYLHQGAKVAQFFVGGNERLVMDEGTKIYQFGNYLSSTNYVLVNDSINAVEIHANDGLNNVYIILTSGVAEIGSGGSDMLYLDQTTFNYTMGDLGAANNQTILTINDANKLFTVSSVGINYLILDVLHNLYKMGDVDGGNLSSYITIDDTAQSFTWQTGGTGNTTVFTDGAITINSDSDNFSSPSLTFHDIFDGSNGILSYAAGIFLMTMFYGLSLSQGGGAGNPVLNITGTTITGATSGNLINIGQTLNTSGNPTILNISVTDTAVGATSKFLKFTNTSFGEVFSIGINGVVYAKGNAGFTGTVTPVTSITVVNGIVTAVS